MFWRSKVVSSASTSLYLTPEAKSISFSFTSTYFLRRERKRVSMSSMAFMVDTKEPMYSYVVALQEEKSSLSFARTYAQCHDRLWREDVDGEDWCTPGNPLDSSMPWLDTTLKLGHGTLPTSGAKLAIPGREKPILQKHLEQLLLWSLKNICQGSLPQFAIKLDVLSHLLWRMPGVGNIFPRLCLRGIRSTSSMPSWTSKSSWIDFTLVGIGRQLKEIGSGHSIWPEAGVSRVCTCQALDPTSAIASSIKAPDMTESKERQCQKTTTDRLLETMPPTCQKNDFFWHMQT